MMKAIFAALLAGTLLLCGSANLVTAGPAVDRIDIRYVPPKNPAHNHIHSRLKQHGALEKLKKFLSPLILPRSLQISLAGCDGEADAFYEDATITVCYEYIDELWQDMPKEVTPAGVAPMDAVIGPLFEISLHEVGHALFDMLKLPVFGREEDAADQMAAYIMLQFGRQQARRLIIGTAHAYKVEEKRTDRRSMQDYAGEHGTPAQRAFNLLCIAYGADRRLFRDVVRRGYLPRHRAEYCDEEFEQVQYAFETLVFPHIDLVLADKVLDRDWLCKGWSGSASKGQSDCGLVPKKKSSD